jgi:hypothetical protein
LWILFSGIIFIRIFLKKTSVKKKNVLAKVKRVPHSATGIVKEILLAAKLLQPIFEASDIDGVFEDTAIKLPKTSIFEEVSTDDSTSGELATRMLHSIQPVDVLREGQVQLRSLFPNLNYGTVWSKRKAFNSLRPGVKSFITKLFNAGLYLPADCPLCSAGIRTCSTVHFLNCVKTKSTLKELCPNCSLKDFMEAPADTYKKCPTFPLLLYAMYCVTMSIVYDSETSVDFVPRVKLRLREEVKRKDYTFF